MIYGLIPAAGQSRRMGRPKLLMRWGERTILEHVLYTLREAGISEILVVTGPHVSELALIAKSAGARALVLAEATADMRQTIEAGLVWLERHFHPTNSDAWLLAPADHPCIGKEAIEPIVAVYVPGTSKTIVTPTFEGKRGHPTLLSWTHAIGLRQFRGDVGLNQYIRSVPNEVLEVPVPSSAVLEDLDTPEAYERLLRNRPRP